MNRTPTDGHPVLEPATRIEEAYMKYTNNPSTQETAGARDDATATTRTGVLRSAVDAAQATRTRAANIYGAAGAYTTATLTAATATTVTARGAGDRASTRRRTLLTLAAVFCVVSALALVLPGTIAHAQGGGFDPESGADEIWQIIGTVGMLIGAIVGIGAIFTRRVLAGLGFLLAGGIIWVVSQDPEGTVGAAAEWLMDAF